MNESEKIEDSELEIPEKLEVSDENNEEQREKLEVPDKNYEKQREKLNEINRKELEKLRLEGWFFSKMKFQKVFFRNTSLLMIWTRPFLES